MFMNVKEGQLFEHSSHNDAQEEAQRLANKLNATVLTVQVCYRTKPERFPANHGKPWSHEDDVTLLINYMSGKYSPKELAPMYERTVWAIQCRLNDLGLGKADPFRNYRGW